jgi:acyl carrier protein
MDPERVRALIAEQLAIDIGAVLDTAWFRDDLGADSLDLVELTMLFEERLGVDICDDESERCRTVGDAMLLLRGKLSLEA